MLSPHRIESQEAPPQNREVTGSLGEAHPSPRKQRMTQLKVNSLPCWW